MRDFTPQRVSGVGGWLLHGDLGMSVRLWASEKSGLELCFLAPSGGGRPWALGRSLHPLIDICYLDGYFSLGQASRWEETSTGSLSTSRWEWN